MKYSIFIGRYQPLHQGHEKLIRSVLNEGKNVCVMLRDTDISSSDPYTVEERKTMFYEKFKEEIDSNRMIVMGVPDVEEVCYGRQVGWGIREIRLDKETENISATKIRGGQL